MRKGKIYPSECRVPKNTKERSESLPKWSVQTNRENIRMGKTRDLFRRRQWHPTPVLLPGKSHGWTTVHGVAKSQTRLSDFTFTFHFRALEKEMATHTSVLAWRIPGMAEPGGLPSMGSHRVGHD